MPKPKHHVKTLANKIIDKFRCMSGKPINPKGRPQSKKGKPDKCFRTKEK